MCPANVARDVFQKLPSKNKKYIELEEVEHEPFRGEGDEVFFKALENWLDQLPFLKE